MSRKLIAALLGLFGFATYIVLAVTLADHLPGGTVREWKTIVQAVYFLAAGVLWTFPARWLMLWSVHQR